MQNYHVCVFRNADDRVQVEVLPLGSRILVFPASSAEAAHALAQDFIGNPQKLVEHCRTVTHSFVAESVHKPVDAGLDLQNLLIKVK